jgi:hypothetical protein
MSIARMIIPGFVIGVRQAHPSRQGGRFFRTSGRAHPVRNLRQAWAVFLSGGDRQLPCPDILQES